MPKKKISKGASKNRSSRSASHRVDDHSFLIILGGGFIVIVLVLSFLSNQSSSREMVTKLTTQVMAQKEQIITINNFEYSPKTITVKVGSSVTWLNSDTVDHSVVMDDTSFDTGLLAPGEKGSYTFTKVGTYTYHCATHPSMTATVVVE